MTLDLSRLDALSVPELQQLAISQGLTFHHKLGKDKLVNIIKEAVLTPQAQQTESHPLIKPAAPVRNNTPEDVEKAIADIKAKRPQLRTSYNTDENTWTFQYIRANGTVGHAEFGNLSIPLRIIKRQAESVAQGAFQLTALNAHFDSLPVSGNNAYTNNVLAP